MKLPARGRSETLSLMRGCTLYALLVAAALTGCGDDDVDCSFEACGGDPVGEWTIVGACAPSTSGGGDGDCPGATIVQSVSYSGSWTFEADMTYAVDGQSLTSVQGSFPRSCLGQVGSCEDLADAGISCQTAGDRCECNSLESEPFEIAGTWAASGSTLTLDGSLWSYCQRGASLKLRTGTDLDETTFVLSR